MLRLLAGALGASVLLSGCAWLDVELPVPTAEPTAGPTGRTECPGSVPSVLTGMRGGLAIALEELQASYVADPGFMAVVFDGSEPIIVVDSATLADWQVRLRPRGLAVAPSCVDTELLAAVHEVLPTVVPPDGSVSAGYNGLDDSIDVMGIDAELFIAALEGHAPGAGDAALAAIADGTLRIDEEALPQMR